MSTGLGPDARKGTDKPQSFFAKVSLLSHGLDRRHVPHNFVDHAHDDSHQLLVIAVLERQLEVRHVHRCGELLRVLTRDLPLVVLVRVRPDEDAWGAFLSMLLSLFREFGQLLEGLLARNVEEEEDSVRAAKVGGGDCSKPVDRREKRSAKTGDSHKNKTKPQIASFLLKDKPLLSRRVPNLKLHPLPVRVDRPDLEVDADRRKVLLVERRFVRETEQKRAFSGLGCAHEQQLCEPVVLLLRLAFRHRHRAVNELAGEGVLESLSVSRGRAFLRR
jgi:hypothetical protein